MEKYLNFAKRSENHRPEVLLTLIDFSDSMDINDYKPSRIKGAIKANIKLITTKAKQYPNDRAGIIVFHSRARILHDLVKLSDGAESLCRSLKQYRDSGATDFTKPLEIAESIFFARSPSLQKNRKGIITKFLSEFLFETNENCPTRHIKKASCTENDITRRIIMLTDGEHNGGGSPVKVAERIKSKGVIIECVGIAGDRKDVDEQILKKIASRDENGTPRYCFIGDSETLLRKYESMAHHIRPV
jgi:hypothetical protein